MCMTTNACVLLQTSKSARENTICCSRHDQSRNSPTRFDSDPTAARQGRNNRTGQHADGARNGWRTARDVARHHHELLPSREYLQALELEPRQMHMLVAAELRWCSALVAEGPCIVTRYQLGSSWAHSIACITSLSTAQMLVKVQLHSQTAVLQSTGTD